MDARSLLRAKKAEARIEHPYAAYTAAGQLRCSVCAIPGQSSLDSPRRMLKPAVQQWEAHLLTKQHRTSVARTKALEADASARASAKRPAASPDDAETSSKRARVHETAEDADEDEDGDAPRLPAGFFSNPSAAAGPSRPSPPAATRPAQALAAAPAPTAAEDPELDDFFASLAEPEESNEAVPTETGDSGRRVAEIEGVASYEAAPVRNVLDPATEDGNLAQPEPEEEETEQQRRERLEREEREEIMDRLAEEERAQ